MINTLYLPELRELLAEQNVAGLEEFCTALHPARTAEFMEGLNASEAWSVLQYTELPNRVEIISFFDLERQIELLETQDLGQVAEVIAEFAPDDRVDILSQVDQEVVQKILDQLPPEERRDILRLSQYPEGTAGAMMTSEVAQLAETFTVLEALEAIGRQAEEFETIYYLYVVDDESHLRGVVSARQLVASMGRPETTIREMMERDLITCRVMDDQEDVANQVARLDLLAIPVVDDDHRLVGIITHDDVIDVVREEATEDAHQMAAVDPLEESYLKTHLLTLSWKRGFWLVFLFFCAFLTAVALQTYDEFLKDWLWLGFLVPLVISSGGNSGSQSAALIITALTRGHVTLKDWWAIARRELVMGLILGGSLALLGYLSVTFFIEIESGYKASLVIPVTLLLVVIVGTLTGSILPLIFERFGLDPAMMSNPLVAGIIDILGIIIYMQVAMFLLSGNS